jgi:methyl-accepting chemotaxis protein
MALLAGLRRRQPEPAPVAAETPPPAEAPAPAAASATFDMIEDDLRRMRGVIAASARGMGAAVDAAGRDAAAIVSDADALAEAIVEAREDVAAIARSFQEISSAGADISAAIRAAETLAGEAQSGAERSGTGVRELDAAIGRIENVVGLIAKVAKQTTLLALNATIEAERAGQAGRGFAVVAGEVKALSVETQRATDEINANIAALQRAARGSIAAVGDVMSTIGQLAPSFAAVSAAVDRQGRIIAEAADLSSRADAAVDRAAERSSAMREGSGTVAARVGEVRTSAAALSETNDAATRRLGTVLRQTQAGDRRVHDRFPAFLPAMLQVAGRDHVSETIDLSEGGALVRAPEAEGLEGARVRLALSGMPPLPMRAVARSSLGLHLALEAGAPAEARAALAEKVAAIRSEYAPLIDRCTGAAARIAALLEEALARGEIDERRLFDTDYRPIAGTDPLQVETPALPVLERLLEPVQEALLASDPRMAFCAAVDRNGWLPVHNRIFSKPQRPGDPVWNAANSRNRRIFDDRAGLTAARNTRPFLVQAYRRDMGGGVTILMREVDAPISVRGRHWGGFRTAYKA